MSSEASGPRSAHHGAEETYELRRGNPSDSRVQKEAEAEVLRAASAYFGRELHPTDLATPSGLTVRVDGVSDDRSVLVEVYVRQGALLAGNKRKVLTEGAVRGAANGQYR